MIEMIAIFLKVTSRKDQEQYWFEKRRPYRYVPVKKFAEEFENFPLRMQTRAELAVPFPKEKSHPAALATKMYSISKLELFKASFNRETILAKRNSIVYVIKIIQVGNYISSQLSSSLLVLFVGSPIETRFFSTTIYSHSTKIISRRNKNKESSTSRPHG